MGSAVEQAVVHEKLRHRCAALVRRLLPILLLVVAIAGCREATPPPQASGADLFRRYCASCHGLDGSGGGAVAAMLVTAPPDLTALRKKLGRFDENAVLSVIDGRRQVAAHGLREMPVWGELFEGDLVAEGRAYPAYTAIARAKLIAEYIGTIQKD